MDNLCLDHLSLSDLPVLDLIGVAAQLECGGVSLFVTPLPLGPYADLVNDMAARREVVAALRDTGLGVGIVEPFMIDAAPDWDMLERTAALAAELGGDVNALAFDDDPARLRDGMARLAQIARAAGTRMTIEAFSMSTARAQADSLALAEYCGPDVGVTVDTLHVMRVSGSWDAVAALPPERIFHVQLDDGPLAPPEDMGAEAVRLRLPPGQGEFDLDAFVPLIPPTARIAVEAPFAAPAGMTPLERGRIVVEATRALLARVPAA